MDEEQNWAMGKSREESCVGKKERKQSDTQQAEGRG